MDGDCVEHRIEGDTVWLDSTLSQLKGLQCGSWLLHFGTRLNGSIEQDHVRRNASRPHLL